MTEPKKIAIVGATSGIGKKLAELYIEKGHKVGISGRRSALLEQIRQQSAQRIEYECFDVTKPGSNIHLDSLVSKLGGLDILIISAGGGEISKELDWQIDKMTIDTNVNGFAEIANWGFNYFVKQGHGSLATISSIASLRGNSWAPAYSASKAFQSNYFEGLVIKAKRLKKNISITCIEPGFVDTHMAKGNKKMWVMPVEKAAKRIITVIEKKKRRSYLSIRWWLVAKVLKLLPYWLFRRIG
ncbi:MAG TPA: SDR family NAD(P)-dependent oxidoreductase [Chitinophagaceae bacterium]|nr:SDR family NAD(P)-dependent oxidoreductase [Chitinophagaceae bacterium]